MLNAHIWKAELRTVPLDIRNPATSTPPEGALGRGIFTDVGKIHDKFKTPLHVLNKGNKKLS
jgi:hypothetical protein